MNDHLEEHNKLKEGLVKAQQLFQALTAEYDEINQKLVLTEDRLVEVRELIRKRTEELKLFEATKLVPVIDEDLRNAEIARFREKLPELMKKLEGEVLTTTR